MRSTLFAFASALVLLAGCAAEAPSGDAEEGALEEDLTAASGRYVGRFASADGAVRLTLAKNGSYTLETGGTPERGVWSGSATQVRLTPSGGALRIYRVTLGTGDRPTLALVRAKVTLSLVRAAQSCASITCATTCTVTDDGGVPTPSCPSVWDAAYAGKKWGIAVHDASSAAFSGGSFRQTLYCALRDQTITCSGAGWGIGGLSAAIAADGTFSYDFVQGTTESRLHGRITTAHVVTVDRYVNALCLGGPGTCERTAAEHVTAQAEPLCTYAGQTFPNGDWTSDALVRCTSCAGGCVEDRP